MSQTLRGKDLVPGKMYTLWGRSNLDTWPAYHQRPTVNGNVAVTPLFPLEPFVFLERRLSDFRYNDNDPMYDYKILTGNGVVGWLSLHDEDLKAFCIGFREYDPSEFEVNL